MKQMKRNVAVAFVVGAWVLTGVGAGAKGPQFRDTITVQGGLLGGAAEEHHLTFNTPVALPGVALAPGTYIFRRMASNVLLVTSAGRKPYAMLSTVSTSRTRSDRYEVILGAPLAEGSPRRLEAWFAPGESSGQQLIYPAAR